MIGLICRIVSSTTLFLFSFHVYAQDTLSVNIARADSLFLKNSFYLLSASMNIEAERAQIIQAKLYPNPVFTADLNAYDPEHKKAFHIGQQGQKGFQFEQLILLGGKRKAEIEMAKTNTAIAEITLQQIARNLKYQLHSSLYALGLQASLLNKYDQQLSLLDHLLSAYQTQVDKGNIALKELVRLKGAYLKLNNDRSELLNEHFGTQAILQKILQVQDIIRFEFSETDLMQYIKTVSLEVLKTTAMANRPDLLILQQQGLLAQQYLQYQKKLAVPDINLFTSYDQNSGAFRNQVNAGFSIPLPLWNRNQGNIRTAQFRVQETEYQVKAMHNEVSSEIQNAYARYIQHVSEYKKATHLYNEDFELVYNGMADNFQKRNVSIVEFTDFFENYSEALTELSRIKTQLVTAAEELNMLAGKDLY
ncbi:MAG: TolC family protein [Chitinophagaceae bacterium]|nr:TolC family protein [Chitinophagaceae bacterium]